MQKIETQKKEHSADTDVFDAYRVVLFNDDEHTFDEVITQLIKAIHCCRHDAEKHAWRVHTHGRSIVYTGSMLLCLKVSSILEEITLKTEIQTT